MARFVCLSCQGVETQFIVVHVHYCFKGKITAFSHVILDWTVAGVTRECLVLLKSLCGLLSVFDPQT